jgi:hypothetical protein
MAPAFRTEDGCQKQGRTSYGSSAVSSDASSYAQILSQLVYQGFEVGEGTGHFPIRDRKRAIRDPGSLAKMGFIGKA